MLIKLFRFKVYPSTTEEKNVDKDWCAWLSSALTEIKMQITKEKRYFTPSSA